MCCRCPPCNRRSVKYRLRSSQFSSSALGVTPPSRRSYTLSVVVTLVRASTSLRTLRSIDHGTMQRVRSSGHTVARVFATHHYMAPTAVAHTIRRSRQSAPPPHHHLGAPRVFATLTLLLACAPITRAHSSTRHWVTRYCTTATKPAVIWTHSAAIER